MIIEKQVANYVKTAIEVTDISLLSNEEYEAAKDNIPAVNIWWWLCSPSWLSCLVSCVGLNGIVGGNSYHVSNGDIGVRPVMRFKPEFANIPTGDKLRLDGFLWTVIAPGLALCDSAICTMPFRKDWKAEDANHYETSDIKAYLDKRFAKYLTTEITA